MSNPQGNDKRLNAIKRATRESIRDKISATKTLTSIDEAEELLLNMAISENDPNNGRVGALRTMLDSKWKKMDRLLPTLKAVEHSGKDGETLLPPKFICEYVKADGSD